MILVSGKVLLNQVNDFLDLAQIKEGTFRIIKEIFFVRPAIIEVYEMFKMNANSKQLKFEYVFDPGVPKLVKADKKRIQQVMRNYLANSLKFTERGGITILVSYNKSI